MWQISPTITLCSVSRIGFVHFGNAHSFPESTKSRLLVSSLTGIVSSGKLLFFVDQHVGRDAGECSTSQQQTKGRSYSHIWNREFGMVFVRLRIPSFLSL